MHLSERFFLLIPPLLYHGMLGVLGLGTALSACSDFRSHRKIQNPASGALDDRATVTMDEMLEHIFYQVNLNILVLHVPQVAS